MILDAVKFHRCTFFPYKFTGLFRHYRPRGMQDANFWTRYDLAQHTARALAAAPRPQSDTPAPLLQARPQQLAQKASPRVALMAVVTPASSDDERPSAGPSGEAAG